MRNVRDIYRKLKELKYKYLVVLYKKYSKKTHENCKFGYLYRVEIMGKPLVLQLCLLHQENQDFSAVIPHIVDICNNSNQCNAFIKKYDKEKIKDIFENELKNNNLKWKKYPEVGMLEWVLEQSTPKESLFDRLFRKKGKLE